MIYTETNMWNPEMKEAARRMELLLRELGYELYRIDEKTHKLSPTCFPDFSFNTVAIAGNRQP